MTLDRKANSPDGEFLPDGSASAESMWPRRVAQAALGGQAAYAQMYGFTSPAVYGLALRMLGDPAEDENGARDPDRAAPGSTQHPRHHRTGQRRPGPGPTASPPQRPLTSYARPNASSATWQRPCWPTSTRAPVSSVRRQHRI